MRTGEIMKKRRKELGLSADKVAEALECSRATIYRYEKGDIEKLPTDILEPLSKVLHLSPAELMGWTEPPSPDRAAAPQPPNGYNPFGSCEGEPEDQNAAFMRDSALPYNPTQRIPILGTISAGLPLYAEQHIEGYTYTDLNHGGEYFGLRVKGDSMTAARIQEGDIVIVKRQPVVENGEIAVVMVDDQDATVKRYHREENGPIVTLSPQSYNPEHQPQIYDLRKTQLTILGKVVRVQFDF